MNDLDGVIHTDATPPLPPATAWLNWTAEVPPPIPTLASQMRRPAASPTVRTDLPSAAARPHFVAPFNGEGRSAVEVLIDSSGRICYADERPTDRDVDGILIERWEGELTGSVRWGHHVPARQFMAMDNPVKCGGCGGQPDVDERGILWMLNVEPGLHDGRLAGSILTATPPFCRRDARRAIQGCDLLREGIIALRVTEADIVGIRGTVYSPNGETPLRDQVVLFDEPTITRVVANQLLRRLSAYTTDETTLPELAGPLQ
ncbi:hypothetical protein [Streptomyces sp. NBC_00209]|uniref:hypothetical protein n=1 Tax=Streptomyces sp. NBC_00209 TaxID=2975682 RepID=UPI0032461C09